MKELQLPGRLKLAPNNAKASQAEVKKYRFFDLRLSSNQFVFKMDPAHQRILNDYAKTQDEGIDDFQKLMKVRRDAELEWCLEALRRRRLLQSSSGTGPNNDDVPFDEILRRAITALCGSSPRDPPKYPRMLVPHSIVMRFPPNAFLDNNRFEGLARDLKRIGDEMNTAILRMAELLSEKLEEPNELVRMMAMCRCAARERSDRCVQRLCFGFKKC